MSTGGGIVMIAAVVVGFIPSRSGSCVGSFFSPVQADEPLRDDGSKPIYPTCVAGGYPGIFWALLVVGITLLVLAIVLQQVSAQLTSRPPRPARPQRATVVVAAQPSAVNRPQDPVRPAPGLATELAALRDLYEAGGLDAEEFAAAKAKVLGHSTATDGT